MKIGIVGNMNNAMFPLMKHLRSRGYDAHLFYSDNNLADHFHPKADTFFLDDLNYCHPISWLNNLFYNVDINIVKKDMEEYDFIISQDAEAAALNFAGIKIDIYFPYGSDIYKYVFLPHEFDFRNKLIAFFFQGRIKIPFKRMKYGTYSKYLYKAIQEAEYVLMEKVNNEFQSYLNRLKLKGTFLEYNMPFLYPQQYIDHFKNTLQSDTHWATEIDKLRKENDFLVLYHGRQEWKSKYENNDFTQKNTHHLIIGFAEFIKEKEKNYSAKLVMLEYGNDVNESKKIITELGIEKHVFWFPKMFRKDLMYLINNVDLCSGEFEKSYLTFGTIVEAMCMGKPVIHYRNNALYSAAYPELYPLLNAREPDEIKDKLLKYYKNKNELADIGKKAKIWADENVLTKSLNKIVELINNKINSKK